MNCKNILLILSVVLVLASCGSSNDSTIDPDGETTVDEVGDADNTGTDDGTNTGVGDGSNGQGSDDTEGGDNDVATDILVTPSGLDLTPLQIEKFTTENIEAALAAFIGLLRGDDQVRIFNEFLKVEALLNDSDSGFQLLSVTDLFGSQIYTCPAGGQISLRSIVDDGETDDNYTIESCSVNDEIFNGTVRVIRDSSDVRGFENSFLSVGGTFGIEQVSGIVEGTTSFASIGQNVATDAEGNQRHSTLFGLGGYERVQPDGNFMRLVRSGSYVGSEISDYLGTAQSGLTGAKVVQVLNASIRFNDGTEIQGATSILNEFLAEDTEADFQVGQLNITIDTNTGNTLSMSASNGDPASFDVVIFDNGSVVNSMTIPWSDRFRFERPPSLR